MSVTNTGMVRPGELVMVVGGVPGPPIIPIKG